MSAPFIGPKIPASRCPACGIVCNAAKTIGDNHERMPKPDSITVCLKCGAICKYSRGLQLVPTSPQDLAVLDYQTVREIHRIHRAIRLLEQRN